jgi:hypothetical protein
MNIKPVMDRMYADREIYCIQPWCVRGGLLTPARLFIGMNERPRVPTCCTCASNWQSLSPQPVELWYLDDDLRTSWWEAIDGAINCGPPPAASAKPAAAPEPAPARKKAWWILGLSAASIIFGIALIIWGNHRAAETWQSSTPWVIWGIFFILLPFLAGAFWVVIQVIKMGVEDAQRYRAWKAGLSPEDRRAVEIAETAAIWAGAAVHHKMHEHHKATQARLRDSAQGIAPLNGAHAGAMRTTALLGQLRQQRQAQWDAQRQFQPDPMRAPFTGTPVSDIHGNVTYRKKPLP